jgi:chorismate mutase
VDRTVTADLLRRAADAMVDKAKRLDEDGAGLIARAVGTELADLIAHRRNTLARDAATLRATADLLLKVHARHAEILSDFKADSEAAQVIAYANTPFMRFVESLARTFLGEQS